jgi:hypothetical protein
MPMFRAFDSWSVCGRLADSTAQTETGVHTNLPRFGPPEGKDLHPACPILYYWYSWSCLQWCTEGIWLWSKEMACASLCVGSMRDMVSMRDCLCEIVYSSRGCPWWLYICSQLGFTNIFLPSTPSYSAGPCGLHVSFERSSSLAGTR